MRKMKSSKKRHPFRRVGIVGAGVMGQAIGRALLTAGLVARGDLWASTKSDESAREVSRELGVRCVTDLSKVPLAETEIIVLAVKPAQTRSALRALTAQGLKKRALVISVVTGVSIEQMGRELPAEAPIIRAVTNTPCVIGKGMTALCHGATATAAHRAAARTIFEQLGRCIDLDENLMEAMTGLSGCGPAYVYLIMEALADGGVRVGLSREQALTIVAQTVLGAASMVQESQRHPASLRDDVTTPAGCTIGALLILEDGKLRSTLARAVEEATKIAQELGAK